MPSRCCGSLLPGALIGYGALTLSGAGLGKASTAAVLATGNVAGVLTRILSAAVTARGSAGGASHGTWWAVAVMMWSGGAGAVCLATGITPVAVGGALLAFSLGWGWSGLAFALVLVGSGGRPAAAGALLQAGGMLGTAVGPVMMSAAVAWWGLGPGWLVIAAAMTLAGLLVMPKGLPVRRIAVARAPK
jgi:MFS transporter, DHA1 family, inner membrane transport protein